MKTQLSISENFLRNTPLPEATDTYTVIPHGFVIDTIRRELAANNFTVTAENFYEGDGGEVAEGEFEIQNDLDPSMGMIFHWQNSYNKKVKFGCAIVGLIYDNNTGMIGSTGAEYLRKHTGTALEEAEETIKELCAQAQNHFQGIIDEKAKMLMIPLDDKLYGQIMGELYFERELVNYTQALVIFKERKRPKFEYQDKDTLWGLYKYIMFGINDAYIGTWQVCQQRIHVIMMSWAHLMQAKAVVDAHSNNHPVDQYLNLPNLKDIVLADPVVEETQEEVVEESFTEETESELIVEFKATEPVSEETEAAVESIQLPEVSEGEVAPADINLHPEATEVETEEETSFDFSTEEDEEEAQDMNVCTEEDFVEEALNKSTQDPASIYRFASEDFHPMMSLEQNIKNFQDKYPEPVKKKAAKKTTKSEETPTPTVAEETPIVPMSNEELMAQLSAAGGNSVGNLSEDDKNLLGLVKQAATTTSTPAGMDFLEVEEVVIQSPVKDPHAELITAHIKNIYNRDVTENDYTKEIIDGLVVIRLNDTKELSYIRA